MTWLAAYARDDETADGLARLQGARWGDTRIVLYHRYRELAGSHGITVVEQDDVFRGRCITLEGPLTVFYEPDRGVLYVSPCRQRPRDCRRMRVKLCEHYAEIG